MANSLNDGLGLPDQLDTLAIQAAEIGIGAVSGAVLGSGGVPNAALQLNLTPNNVTNAGSILSVGLISGAASVFGLAGYFPNVVASTAASGANAFFTNVRASTDLSGAAVRVTNSVASTATSGANAFFTNVVASTDVSGAAGRFTDLVATSVSGTTVNASNAVLAGSVSSVGQISGAGTVFGLVGQFPNMIASTAASGANAFFTNVVASTDISGAAGRFTDVVATSVSGTTVNASNAVLAGSVVAQSISGAGTGAFGTSVTSPTYVFTTQISGTGNIITSGSINGTLHTTSLSGGSTFSANMYDATFGGYISGTSSSNALTWGANANITGSVVAEGRKLASATTIMSGSPSIWGAVIQAGSNTTDGASGVWLAFNTAFSAIPYVVVTPEGADGGTVMGVSGAANAGSVFVFSSAASKSFNWIAVGTI